MNGAGQGGTSLAIDGLPANKALLEGWFFSLIIAGQRYLYQITADAVASATGAVTLSIVPMLRVVPPDNTVVELATPMIEGFLQDGVKWSIESAIEVGLAFTIFEIE